MIILFQAGRRNGEFLFLPMQQV